MKPDIELFRGVLSIDSTSGSERAIAELLHRRLEAPRKTLMEVGDGSLNLLLEWGTPRVVFCTHMDTVPPYIPPRLDGEMVHGRGACDAKGQILALYTACKELEAAGESGFALLLLSGEETGSWGAKAFAKTDFRAPYLVIGEPTENRMVSASKGTKSFDLKFTGEAFHSGYPEFGRSAVDMFVDFVNTLRAHDFCVDPVLGATTWNVGLLSSDNPQNVLSPELTCRIYFRTTFISDAAVTEYMAGLGPGIEVTPRGGDAPAEYLTVDGIPSAPASFGSDAPHLSNFAHKAIIGPGSIRTAHRDDECVSLRDIETAVENCIRIFHSLA